MINVTGTNVFFFAFAFACWCVIFIKKKKTEVGFSYLHCKEPHKQTG
jgi:hypothetical protein